MLAPEAFVEEEKPMLVPEAVAEEDEEAMLVPKLFVEEKDEAMLSPEACLEDEEDAMLVPKAAVEEEECMSRPNSMDKTLRGSTVPPNFCFTSVVEYC